MEESRNFMVMNTEVHQGILRRKVLECRQLAVGKVRTVKVRKVLLEKGDSRALAQKLEQISSLWELPILGSQ